MFVLVGLGFVIIAVSNDTDASQDSAGLVQPR